MILDDWEKDYTCLMFNNLRKLTKILTRTNSMQHILFHFSRNMGDIKIFSLHKKAGSILKNCLEIDLWGKKEHFAKHLIVCKFFWDSLVQNLLNFLELYMFINAYLPKYYLTRWTGNLGMKKNILFDTIFIFQKNSQMTWTNDL